MARIKEQEIFVNPYVVQMDKFAESLQHLSKTFLNMEHYKGTLSKEEIDEMFDKVTGNVCAGCERKEVCLGERREKTYQMMYEIMCAAEEYGAELNMELKKRLKRQCMLAPRFLRESLEVFENAKQILMWNHRMLQTREGYATQLTSFAKMIQYTTRELDAGIFQDEYLEKRIKTALKKENVKMLSIVFYMTQQGKYEVHLTVKAVKGRVILAKDIAFLVGKCIGRTMITRQGERLVIGGEYGTIACVEGAKFQTLQGIARIGKGLEQISGDTFLMKDLPGGRKGIALSDGMGSGEEAFRDSTMVVEMLEELLEAGFPVETAVQMMNTALVIGREEVKFCTLDVCLFDLYRGSCEFVKAGAAATFIKKKDKVEKIVSTTLPIGVIQNIEIDREVCDLESGDYVVMVTDGVLDALPAKEQEEQMIDIIQNTNIVNPTEFARSILSEVLKYSGEMPLDDMTILVIDGQGGKLGKRLVVSIKKSFPQVEVMAVGTNSAASESMMRAGADRVATGENPVIVASRTAQIIVGPMGIAIADALMGEISPAMANAVAASAAYRVLIPMNLCDTYVAGVSQKSSAIMDDAMEHIRQLLTEMGDTACL